MNHLPVEIVTQILHEAAVDDVQTASRLCLVNRSYQKELSPILYQHVCLAGTKQVKQFNKTLKSSPHLQMHIKGLTLLEDLPSYVPIRWEDSSWKIHWKQLIKQVDILSRRHSLETLVLSREVCARFVYTREYNDKMCERPIGDELKITKLRIDHLVISHYDTGFFMETMDIRKLTWYGCERGRSSVFPRPVNFLVSRCTRRLEEICILIGDKVDPKYPFRPQAGPDFHSLFEALFDSWTRLFVIQINRICKMQEAQPKLKLFLHREAQEVKGSFERQLQRLETPVKLGVWGTSSDTCQRLAEERSFYRMDYIHSKASVSFIQARKNHSAVWCNCKKGQDDDDDDDEDDDTDWDEPV
jgi:hypothetical protein